MPASTWSDDRDRPADLRAVVLAAALHEELGTGKYNQCCAATHFDGLGQGADSVEAHFPAGTWFSAWDEAGAEAPIVAGRAGRQEKLAAPLGHVPVHLRGGAVLPLQAAGLTTAAVRASGLTLVVALPEQARP